MTKTEQISIPWEVKLVRLGSEPASTLLLHGFMQTAERVSKLLEPSLAESGICAVSIQAPFPVYKQLPDRYRVGYSWYFYDHLSKVHVIKKETAVQFISSVLEHLGELEEISTVIGFSQGAYLAPHVASVLPKAQLVVGIGGRFMADQFSSPPQFDLVQIHGSDDQVVDPELTRIQHEQLVNKGVNSQLHVLQGVGHEINDLVRAQLSTVLNR